MSSTFSNMELDGFRLRDQIGVGGMSEVWAAEHPRWDRPVAVKLVSPSRTRTPEVRQAFHREIRAMARLSHPTIIDVYDQGVFDDAEAGDDTDSRGLYLVMELADASMKSLERSTLGWRHLRSLLLSLLGGLAHAHAHGLIHRDLKPGNVLFVGSDEGIQPRLADFGMVHQFDQLDLTDRQECDDRLLGTPRYMAPEQFAGKWRDQGPWTDLYALGCITYWLTTGAPPFDGPVPTLLLAHGRADRPPVDSHIPVPDGFETWVHRLMAIDIEQRYRTAADAARDLLKLDRQNDDAPGSDWRPHSRPPNWSHKLLDTSGQTASERTHTEPTVLTDPLPESRSSHAGSPTESDASEHRATSTLSAAGLPDDWRPPQSSEDHFQPSRVGLGLAAHRQVPVVGRQSQRDEMWELFFDTVATASPRAVLLRGPTGCGKTRLARWIGRRAHELAGAQFMEATHSGVGGPRDGIASMLAAHLGCTGLDTDKILERIHRLYLPDQPQKPDLYAADALAEFIAPCADPNYDPDRARVQFGSAHQRLDVVLHFFRWATRSGPAVVLLDDVHLSTDSVEYARHILDSPTAGPLPALLVMTAQSDGTSTSLGSHHRVREICLEPMASEQLHHIVSGLVPVQPQLAKRVARASGGNPLFAVQLIEDWLDRGVLQASAQGYTLASGDDSPRVPDSMSHLLRQRLEQALGHSLDAVSERLKALELAAALGHSVEWREWKELCTRNGIDASFGLVTTLTDQQLVECNQHGFSFTHSSVCQLLEQTARDHRRWADHHQHCAHTLQQLYSDANSAVQARCVHHLLEAGELHRAAELFDPVMEYFRATGDYDRALQLCSRFEETLDRLDHPDDQRLRLAPWLGRIKMYSRQQRLEKMTKLVNRAEPVARAHGTVRDRAQVAYYRAVKHWLNGQLDQAAELASHSLELHLQTDNPRDCTSSQILLAEILRNDQQLHRSEQLYEQAFRTAHQLQDYFLMSLCHLGLSNIALKNEHYQQAIEQAQRARQLREKLGNLNALATAVLTLGSIYHQMGRLDDAKRHYQQGNSICRRLQLNHHQMLTHTKLGLLCVQQSSSHQAVEYLQQALDEATSRNLDAPRTCVHVAMLHPLADTEQWSRFEDHLQNALQRWTTPVPEAPRLRVQLDDTIELCRDQHRHGYLDQLDELKRRFAESLS